jgi:hypothetical protein
MQNRTQSTNPWFNQVYPTGWSVGQANLDGPWPRQNVLTIYIQEIEIRSYVISLGDDDFIFSAQKIFVTYLRNTKKENFKNVMFLE